MNSAVNSWWFSLVLVIIGLSMFNRYIVPAAQNDLIIHFAGELLFWLALTIIFFIRFIIQIKQTRSPKL